MNTDGPLLGRANISYEYSERTKALSHGGMGMIARLVACTGLAEEIDSALSLLKIHHPYFESDHVRGVSLFSLTWLGRRWPSCPSPMQLWPGRRAGR